MSRAQVASVFPTLREKGLGMRPSQLAMYSASVAHTYNCPSLVECNDKQKFQGFRTHHLSIDIIRIAADTLLLCEPPPVFACFVFFYRSIRFALDHIYPFGVDDFGAFWDIRFFDLGESGVFTSCDRSFSLAFAHFFGWCEDRACSLVGWSAYSEDSGSRIDFRVPAS